VDGAKRASALARSSNWGRVRPRHWRQNFAELLGADKLTFMPMSDTLPDQLANSRAYWGGWGHCWRSDGLETFRSGVGHPLLNGVLRFDADGSDALDEAVALTRERLTGLPWAWWVGPDSRLGLGEDLRLRGAQLVETFPVMGLDVDDAATAAPPEGLRIEEVADTDLQEWVGAWVGPFAIPTDEVPRLTGLEAARALPPQDVVRLAGRVEGEIVATSMLAVAAGVAGMYVVATAAGHRGHGIGAAMTAALVDAARERGVRTATLQATAAGARVYRRLGFVPLGEYQLYVL